MIFKLERCPRLSEYQIKSLIKGFNPDIKYIIW